MIRRHQINDSLSKPLPQFFAILPAADWRRALEKGLPVWNFVRRKMQVMRTSFNAHRQSFRLRCADYIQRLASRQMDDVQTEMILAAQGDHELNSGKLRFIRSRLQIRRVFAPVRLRQLACCLVHTLAQVRVYEPRHGQSRVKEQRKAGPRDTRQGRAELPLGDHGEAVNAGMNEEAFESRH